MRLTGFTKKSRGSSCIELHQWPFCFILFSVFMVVSSYCLGGSEHLWSCVGNALAIWKFQLLPTSVLGAGLCPSSHNSQRFPCLSACHVAFSSLQDLARCARCSLSPALNYAVTLPCLFRFNCYKLKWTAKPVWFFKSWRFPGAMSFSLRVATWGCCYGFELLLLANKKIIWNVLAGEKWFNLQASNNNIYIWCKLLGAKSLLQRGLSSGVQSGCKCAHLWITGFYFFMLH